MTLIDPGPPSEEAEKTEARLARVDIFRAAHALVDSLTWEDTVGVHEVLQVARFLEDGS